MLSAAWRPNDRTQPKGNFRFVAIWCSTARPHVAACTSRTVDRLTPAQARAARAMLDWTVLDLAPAARVSVSTVKRFEGGGHQPLSADIVATMRDTSETEGVRLLVDDGSGARG